MTKHKPRHAIRQTGRSTAIVAIVASIAIVTGVILIISMLMGKPQPQAQPTVQPPAPQPTWTSYVPTTPNVCRQAMEAADEMFDQSKKTNNATIKAASLASEQKFTAAQDQIAIARESIKKLERAEDKYVMLSERCKGEK